MLAPFTTTDEVRALLGVSDEELSDTVLNLPVYEHGLRLQLQKVSAGLPALFITLVDPVTHAPLPTLTGDEAAFVASVKYFSTVEGSIQAGTSLALVAPKRLTDDKSGMERFSDSPYRDVLDRLKLKSIEAKGALLVALEALTGAQSSSAVVSRRFVAVKRGYDPITGEGGTVT